MTMTRTPDGKSAGPGTHPGPGNRGPGLAGFSARLTIGGYVLMVAALLVSGLSLARAAPGWPPAAYLGAAAAVALLFGVVFSGLPGAGPDGGRIVRALTWARPGDAARASQFGALRTGRGKAASR